MPEALLGFACTCLPAMVVVEGRTPAQTHNLADCRGWLLLQLPETGSPVMVRSMPLSKCTTEKLPGNPICCQAMMVTQSEAACKHGVRPGCSVMPCSMLHAATLAAACAALVGLLASGLASVTKWSVCSKQLHEHMPCPCTCSNAWWRLPRPPPHPSSCGNAPVQ